MEVIIAKSAGFCFGVERAINRIKELEKQKENREVIHTLGPIIHNPTVVNALKKKNIFPIDPEEAYKLDSGTVIIRSHGVPKSIYDKLKDKKLNIIDTTCPYVKNVHKKVNYLENARYRVLIIGKKDHPEVEGIIGQCENKPLVVNSPEEAFRLRLPQKIGIVAQTTILKAQFKEIINIVIDKCKDILIFNTICAATEERQKDASKLAKACDAMIVIGGKTSSNTNKLDQICREHREKVYFIEEIEELDLEELKDLNTIGITAGASTPSQSIQRVVDAIEKRFDASIKSK